MPPFAEYDNSSFVNNAALFLTKPVTATDVYVTSKVTSFYEKLFDFNLCCSFGQDEISIPNNNDNMTQDDNKQTHQVVNEIRQDIWMRKAEEADYRNEAVAERFQSSSAKSASIFGARDDDEITVQFSNSSQQEEEKKLVVSMQKPSLFVHGKQSVISWNKYNNNEAINVWSTKKECWLTKHTKKLYLTKRAKVATSEHGMLTNGRKKPSLMKRIKKSMLMTKIKNNRTTSDDQKETQGVCSWKPICSQLEEI